MKNNTWSGRFIKGIDSDVLDFSQSLSVDLVLYDVDIRVTEVHVEMLYKCKHLTKSDFQKIVSGLKKVRKLADSGKLPWSVKLEDVHMNIENSLVKIIGPVGKKIHLGRSRNDLVTTDLRLYLRELSEFIIIRLRNLRFSLAKLAKVYSSDLFPGYTHLQIAQPVVFGHHLLAWAEMFARDEKRIENTMSLMNTLPLGSAAMSGTSLKIDRKFVAKKLGFASVSNNSMDAVSDRDYVIDLAYSNSMIMMHLSRVCEEIVLWMNPQFNLIDLDQGFCTGSSIMPQKKNPDVAELVRGKTGSVYGNLVGLLTLMKGLPLTYNRDLQEDKEQIFTSVDTTLSCIEIISKMIPTIVLNKQRASELSGTSFSTATDIAEYLSLKGMPFREAHHLVGKIIKYCEDKHCSLEEIPESEFQKFSNLIEADIYKKIIPSNTVKMRSNKGDTSPKLVEKEANILIKALKKYEQKQ